MELLPLVLLLLTLLIATTVSVQPESNTNTTSSTEQEPYEWPIYTDQNYTPEARIKPHILMGTVPHTKWSQAEDGARNENPYHEMLIKTQTQKLKTVNKIAPGSILFATKKLTGVFQYPYLLDGSKVLIVKANQSTGFQGLIINRLVPWETFTLLVEGLDPLKDAPLSYGGPHYTTRRPLFALTRQSVKDEHPEILPNIYFLDEVATVKLRKNLKLHKLSVTDYWFFMGYLKWDWDELFDQIADGSWEITSGREARLDWPMKRWNFGNLLGRSSSYNFRA